jgi:hypothetical protein
MAPTPAGVETRSNIEKEQSTEQPEKPSEPPFTEEERLREQADSIETTLTDLRPAAQKDEKELDQTEQTFTREFPEPPAEFDEPPHTVQEVQALEGQQREIQRQLGNDRQPQPEPQIAEGQPPEKGMYKEPPRTETRPPIFHEAPIRVEATREQTAEQLQQKTEQALDKINTEIENNGGQMPENSAGVTDLKNVFKGSRLVSENTINAQIERLQNDRATFQKDKGQAPTKEQFRELGTAALREQIGLAAQENPQEVQKSPFAKQQEERLAEKLPGRDEDIPVQENPMTPQTEDKSRVSNREI